MQGELRGDLTRDTFDPLKHFTKVLRQQGRVDLEANWNEQAAIVLHYLQTLAADLIGPRGCPKDLDGSFEISSVKDVSNDFRIGAGHYYVDGILCELEATPVPLTSVSTADPYKVQVAFWHVDGLDFLVDQYVEIFSAASPSTPSPLIARITAVDPALLTLTLSASASAFGRPSVPMLRRVTTYRAQPDFPIHSGDKLTLGNHLVYLDVWERHINYIEDDSIREVALGGPDTATRAKVVWQVKTQEGVPACPGAPADWIALVNKWQPPNRGQLKARAKQESASTDPCIVLPAARYRGAENQLYRVEIHRGGTASLADQATFKWSRDNSSVELPIRTLQGNVVTLERPGRDARLGLKVGDSVEIVDDTRTLRGHYGALAQVGVISDPAGVTITLRPPTGVSLPPYTERDQRHPLLRRWDYQPGEATQGKAQKATDGALLLEEDRWLALEDGIQILFAKPAPGQTNRYRTGDYWLIPARTATGDVEWPVERDGTGKPVYDTADHTIPAALPPHGIEHHYAPLAIIKVNDTVSRTTDCRSKFKTVVGLS